MFRMPDVWRWPLFLYGGALVTLWGSFILELHFHWGWESYYNFGWTVPIVGMALLHMRWRDAPKPEPIEGSRRTLLAIGCLIGLILLLPLRLMNEVNVFWRVPFLFQSWILVAVSWSFLFMVGGRRWFLHFGFPIAFFLTFVPWPYRIEVQVIQGLTHYITASAVQVLHVLGYPAQVQGNTIVVGTHWLGVDQACSGIRSLQALTMVALWLGEYFRLAIKGRLFVLGGAILLMAIFNLLRATGLTIATFQGGTHAYDQWHDPLGFATFIVSIVLLYFLCEWFGGKVNKKVRNTAKSDWRNLSKMVGPHWIAWAAIVVGIGLPLASEGWFRWRESTAERLPSWTVDLDYNSPRIRQMEIPEKVRTVLNFNYGVRCVYESGLGQDLDFYFYGYTGEDKMQSVASYGHRPDICMTSQGAHPAGEQPPLSIEIAPDLDLTLRHFLFESAARDGVESELLQVFWMVWEKRNMGFDASELDALNYRTQIEMLWAGRRDYARQVILVSMRNVDSTTTARRKVRAFLAEHIKVLDED